ncbi:MAG: hypothetical protein EPN88_06835 [Bacteroidetes bacterium]|nr:MAG: hypothetical protein EPN88_06835 [Bacteroidota bacterium]
MKRFIITSILAGLLATGTSVIAQDQKDDYLGLPGDNLNLYAVMKMFQESKTLEEFEKRLNDENSKINNLDLNGDNVVDYISVFDNIEGNVHNIVMQVAVNEMEKQDVAVFTVEREPDGQVQIQLTGDEELYGKNYIIEPIFDDANNSQTPNPGYTGNTRIINGQNVTVTRTTRVEIASWPLIRFIYLPNYVIWRSSWYWGYYPSYWHTWQPYYWHYYYGYHYNWYNDYYGHYRRWDHHRYSHWNDFYYTSKRSHSPFVDVRIKNGNYGNTYSHPEQKKEGEALYSRMHQDQNNRRSDNNTGNTSVRRSASESNQDRQSAGTRNTTNRRAGTTVTNKSVTNPSEKKNTGTTRRSDTGLTGKSDTEQPSRQKASSNQASGQSKTTGVSKSDRRKNSSTKSGTTVKKDVKTKETDKTKERR